MAGYLLVCGVAVGLLPRHDEVPADFPATVLYSFRTGSFGTQFALWAVLGIVLAELAHRLVHRSDRAARTGPQIAAVPS